MYTITKQFEFEASHRLRGMPEGHQCARQHGHSYVVEVELRSGNLTPEGFVRDFGELRDVKEFIDGKLDHRDLWDADVIGALKVNAREWNPTAENLAYALFQIFRDVYSELAAVRVSETRKTWAEYRPSMDLTELLER